MIHHERTPSHCNSPFLDFNFYNFFQNHLLPPYYCNNLFIISTGCLEKFSVIIDIELYSYVLHTNQSDQSISLRTGHFG
ncbi:hypothetical protein L1887_16583 [Cichorium endivia]|nr:hypothetical protein L1887_16583 [Cichorium endivia]